MGDFFIEEWYFVISPDQKIVDFEETTTFINGLQVKFKISENYWYKESNIDYMIYIPYSNSIFTKEYIEEFDVNNPSENDEFCDELDNLRVGIEEGIEKYLKDKKKLIDVEY
ncbi:hypothetical protein ACWYRQ_15585 [Clostridioides difficile]